MTYFRRVDEPFQTALFERWQVEIYDVDGRMFPVALAFVINIPSGDNQIAQLNFFYVADGWRGRGIGSKLLAACCDKWPNLSSTSAMNDQAKFMLQKHGLIDSDSD